MSFQVNFKTKICTMKVLRNFKLMKIIVVGKSYLLKIVVLKIIKLNAGLLY